MKHLKHLAKILCVLALGLGVCTSGLWARSFTDQAGRTVELPATIKTYYTTSQIGIIALYCLNPDKLVGWGFALTNGEQKYIPAAYHKLPVLGVWSGKNGTGNVEEIARVKPDVIFSIGDIDPTYISQCDRIQAQTGVPVVMVKAPLNDLGSMYRYVGAITGEDKRAGELASYCDELMARVQVIVKKLPADKRIKVYYAEGPKGLQTDPSGSMHTEVLDLVGGVNVAQVPNQKGYGRSEVNLEQLYQWNPDLIILGKDKEGPTGSADTILGDPLWQPVKAVKNKAVYVIPNDPFDWFDRPPSVNRLVGVMWLLKVLYPDQASYDLVQETQKFYQLFYRYKLGADEAKALLGPAAALK